MIPKYLMQIKYVKALELKLEVCIWVTSWPIICAGTKVVSLFKYSKPLWRKCAIFVCANHACLNWIWTQLESLRLTYVFLFFFSSFFSPPFHFSTFQLLWMAFNTSLQPQRHFLEERNFLEWMRTSILNILPACFEMQEPFCCPLHRFFSLPLPHLHLFFLFAPLFALCALEWSPCTGMASWGELVKHLLQPLQFCVILASTEPLMLGL